MGADTICVPLLKLYDNKYCNVIFTPLSESIGQNGETANSSSILSVLKTPRAVSPKLQSSSNGVESLSKPLVLNSMEGPIPKFSVDFPILRSLLETKMD
jgi:hypothetical protein